jgi:hypothetical protein
MVLKFIRVSGGLSLNSWGAPLPFTKDGRLGLLKNSVEITRGASYSVSLGISSFTILFSG